MSSSTSPGRKRGISARQAPVATAVFSPQVCPNEWNSGSAPRITSSGSTEISPRMTSALRARLPCVSSAPFGLPVVPDV